MLKKLNYLAFAGVMALATTGCSLDSSLTGLESVVDLFPFDKVSQAEIVSGSTQYRLTTNNYKVSASAGSVYDKLEGKTANNYKVYITVQGQMLSSDP